MIKINYDVVEIGSFPDNTQLIKLNRDIMPRDTTSSEVRITWQYDSDAELFTLIALTEHLKDKGFEVGLILPYVPNARMDRVKNSYEVFTLKHFAKIINFLNFKYVTITNPHSTVSEALFDRCKVDFESVVNNVEYINRHLNIAKMPINAIYYPDAGAHKKFEDMLACFAPSCYGEKIRDWQTGQIQGLTIMNPSCCKGDTILIVDDIISYGGSMYFSVLELQKLGFKNIYCYATHVENSILDKERGKLIKLDCVKKIYTTNSIYRKPAEETEFSRKIEIIRRF